MHTTTNSITLTENVFPQFQDVNRYLIGHALCEKFKAREEHSVINKAYKENDAQALRLLHQQQSRFVVPIARLSQSSGILLDVLIREGNKGLRKAIASYVPNRKTRLSTHCSHLIRDCREPDASFSNRLKSVNNETGITMASVND